MKRSRSFLLLPLLLFCAAPALAFDINGVAIGASEQEVKKKFPSAHCKPLEWKTDAADRRCDDARAAFSGIPSRLTFYLRGDKVQGFDLRFDIKDLERVKSQLKSRWGAPQAETVETIARREGEDRKVLKMRWEKGPDHATLVSQLDKKRIGVEVARGTLFDDIYKVK
jgi:hypothetical protein